MLTLPLSCLLYYSFCDFNFHILYSWKCYFFNINLDISFLVAFHFFLHLHAFIWDHFSLPEEVLLVFFKTRDCYCWIFSGFFCLKIIYFIFTFETYFTGYRILDSNDVFQHSEDTSFWLVSVENLGVWIFVVPLKVIMWLFSPFSGCF